MVKGIIINQGNTISLAWENKQTQDAQKDQDKLELNMYEYKKRWKG